MEVICKCGGLIPDEDIQVYCGSNEEYDYETAEFYCSCGFHGEITTVGGFFDFDDAKEALIEFIKYS